MILKELRADNLRNLHDLRVEPRPGINLLIGANGAGKTSILEAVYLLSHGRSFRTRRNQALRRSGAESASIFGVVEGRSGSSARLGLALTGERWTGRVDGQDVPTLTQLLIHCAVTCFEPGSHALISGPSENRRRFVDWGVFHVEPEFPEAARRYRRALRQRNAALRSNSPPGSLDSWDAELALSAERLTALRNAYLARLGPILQELADSYLPELGGCELRSRQGWPLDVSLPEALRAARELDRLRGHTTRGPHRADWQLVFVRAPHREQLSRGQEKLCAIACMVAQARLFFLDRGEWPIVILDDLASELDAMHRALALDSLAAVDQVFVSATDASALGEISAAKFHVEQGTIACLL